MQKSLWLSYSDPTNFKKLESDITVDVAIIGGGMTGITTAQLLSQQGLTVAVLEREKVAISSTGHSTGNLYSAVSEILTKVQSKFGDNVMKMTIDSRREAINLIEQNVVKYNIDCDFKRVTWNYYTTLHANKSKIEKAYENAKTAGLKVEYSDLKDAPFEVQKGISLDEAAQFNPLRYVQGLAKAISSENCQIFEDSEVKDIQEGSKEVTLTCENGRRVKAKFLVHATHTPKGVMTYHMELGPYREYGIACKIQGDHPEGVYFGYFQPGDVTSTRTYVRDGQRYLIAVGEPHKVGHGDNSYHVKRLEEFVREHFNVLEVTHTWGAQNYKAADHLPYIGHLASESNVFIATGFSSHGLTYGTVAAQVLSDLITGKDNPYAEMYKPYRFNPVKAAPKLIKENIDVGIQLVKDYLLTKHEKHFADVGAGEGKVIQHEGHKLAVFRDEKETLQVCSAICPHMGCVVHFNNVEASWDCPCHGSRFGTDGEVLEGPALKALARIDELLGTPTLEEMGESRRTDQQHVMSEEELIDQASIESFPASDPPGHISVSKVDREQHDHR